REGKPAFGRVPRVPPKRLVGALPREDDLSATPHQPAQHPDEKHPAIGDRLAQTTDLAWPGLEEFPSRDCQLGKRNAESGGRPARRGQLPTVRAIGEADGKRLRWIVRRLAHEPSDHGGVNAAREHHAERYVRHQLPTYRRA